MDVALVEEPGRGVWLGGVMEASIALGVGTADEDEENELDEPRMEGLTLPGIGVVGPGVAEGLIVVGGTSGLLFGDDFAEPPGPFSIRFIVPEGSSLTFSLLPG